MSKKGAHIWGMKGRKRSFVFIVGHGAIFIGIIGLNGCIQTEVQPQNLHLRISHLGGEPFAYRWVLPVQSENNTTGWWSQPSWTSTGDTVWTDEFGRATLLSFTSNTRGLVCQPFDGKDAPYYINFGFYPTTSCADHDLILPQKVWIQFIGNRNGDCLGQSVVIRPELTASNVDTWHSFTPGCPPLPTVCLQDWVHPFEDPPERRFHLYTAEGLLLKTVLSPIPESFLGDTLIIPIQF